VLKRVRAVRSGKNTAVRRMRVRFWRIGCEDKGVVEAIVIGRAAKILVKEPYCGG